MLSSVGEGIKKLPEQAQQTITNAATMKIADSMGSTSNKSSIAKSIENVGVYKATLDHLGGNKNDSLDNKVEELKKTVHENQHSEIFNGAITPNQKITVSKLYTYPT